MGRKRTICRGGNWSRNCYFAGYNIPANDVCACVRMQWFVLTTLLWMLSTVLCAVLLSYWVKVLLFLVWQQFSCFQNRKKTIFTMSSEKKLYIAVFVTFYCTHNIKCLRKMCFPLLIEELRSLIHCSESVHSDQFQKWFTDSFQCSLLYTRNTHWVCVHGVCGVHSVCALWMG